MANRKQELNIWLSYKEINKEGKSVNIGFEYTRHEKGYRYVGFYEYETAEHSCQGCIVEDFCFDYFETKGFYWTAKKIYQLARQVSQMADVKYSYVCNRLVETLAYSGRIKTMEHYKQIVNSRRFKNINFMLSEYGMQDIIDEQN